VLRIGRNRIAQLPIGLQMAIEEHEWNFILSFRQMQLPLRLIANHMQAEQPCVDVQPVDAHCVIVIPEQCRILLVGIVVGARLSGHIPVFGKSIALGRRLAAMQMHDAAHFRVTAFSAAQ
jgi:hypothetical protein